MTVYIEKPAVNLREELASLRNQGGYSEQQFYFDSLVTNGTFDTDISGWTDLSSGTGTFTWDASGAAALSFTDTSNQGKMESNTIPAGTHVLTFDNVGTGNAYLSATLGVTSATVIAGASHSQIIAPTTPTSIRIYGSSGTGTLIDNVSVYETDGTDVIHTMPKGWKPKDFYEDGLLQREGAAHDYTVVYDGFDYYVKPAVAPSASTQTCVIGVKA
jgi:hypothetical protein|tara:strand:- start:459 stop:1106 length:648 start_codon:yes stop_codon:yes gene_type:complete